MDSIATHFLLIQSVSKKGPVTSLSMISEAWMLLIYVFSLISNDTLSEGH